MKRILFLIAFSFSNFTFAQPGPSTLRVSFTLPATYNLEEFPKQMTGGITTFLNGKQQAGGSGKVYFRSPPTPYHQPKATFSIDGHPSGIDIFDSVAIGITLEGKSYSVHGTVRSTNSLFVADFSGEYKNPVIHAVDYTAPTQYPTSRPKKEVLRAAIDQNSKKTARYNGPYFIVQSSDGKRISDALVVCNGDTLPQISNGLYIPTDWIKTKKRIEVYHPEYPSLVLDSCILPLETVYLLKEHEPYYIDMGLKHPLKNNNHQKVALRFDLGITQETMDSCLQEICINQHYNVAYHYPDSLKVHNEMLYGGVADLNRIVLLERRIPATIGNSYHRQFNYFKNNFPIDAIFRPVNHSTFLNNEVSIIFKDGTSQKTINEIEKQFNLQGLRSKYQHHKAPLFVHYQLDVFITPNYLVEQLMKNHHIKNVIIGKVEYTNYG